MWKLCVFCGENGAFWGFFNAFRDVKLEGLNPVTAQKLIDDALIKEAKEYNTDAYFIVITARGELSDKLKGFELGADDYLPKPFSLLEVFSIQASACGNSFSITCS